ncbi:Lrp/AsnC family transcriptional regulator [Rhodococcus sp. NPDC059968]|uniref:Lrp/AsnC family transcriptional regulator n=1 Tax=Rhodococcus sp. NPDC059968 TaxID=3347017 RepID=UPI00366C0255
MNSDYVDEDFDEIDRGLVTALQRDGRLGYGELGALVGLTAGGARRRVMRLEERGVVQIVGVTDPLKLGYRSMAMVGIVASGDVEEVADALAEIENVIYVVLCAGRCDLLVEVIAENQDALFRLVNDKLRRIEGILHIDTFTYYSIRTHRFGWGTR